MRLHRHSDVVDGARPKHGALARHEYGLLAQEDPAGDPATAEPHGSGDSPKDTLETGCANGRETGTGEQNGQRALFACGQTEDEAEEQVPPKHQRALNACSHQGGKEGTTHPAARASRARPGDGGYHPD